MFDKLLLKSSIFAAIILFTCSCSQLRYTDYGKPFDFLKAKKVAHLSIGEIENKDVKSVSIVPKNKKADLPISSQPLKQIKAIDLTTSKPNTFVVAEKSFNQKNSIPFSYNEKRKSVDAPNSLINKLLLEDNNVESVEHEFSDDTEAIVLAILCVFIPPLAVFLLYDLSNEFWIDLLLTICFFLPGILYAFYLCFIK